MTTQFSLPRWSRESVATTVVYAIFAITGIGTGLPGTLLPLLLLHWRLSDAGAGVLFLSLFLGSSAGSLLARGVLGRTLVAGCSLAACAMFLFLHLEHGETALMALYGLGLGTAMTSISLLQSRRVPEQRTREMARLNLFWAAGAFTSPFLLLHSSSTFGLTAALTGFATLLAVAAIVACVTVPKVDAQLAPSRGWRQTTRGIPPVFVCLIPLSTGIETGVGSWLSTYSTRAGHLLNITISTVTAFWAGLLLSRLLAAQTRLGSRPARWLLPRLSTMMFVGVGLLLVSLRPIAAITGAFLAGVGVGPVFPLLLALQLECGEANNAGFLVAGLGAALMPLLTGAVSSWTHSLRAGISILLLAVVLLPLLGRHVVRHDAEI